MTPLFRFAPIESPHLGRRTLWTLSKDRETAESLALWEARRPLPPSRLYRINADLRNERSIDWTEVSPGLRDVRPADFVKLLDDQAPDGCEWMQITDHGRAWRGGA